MVPSFNRMKVLWDDLEIWSSLDQAGERGVFHARTIGGHVHIGYPLAQSLLTDQERRALPRIFYAAKLDPTATPPADELARALRSPTSKGLMRPRTIRLLESQPDADHFRAVLETVASELAEWDGELQDENPGGCSTRRALGGLRICVDLDVVARTASTSVRCRLKREFPEEGLEVEIPGIPGQFLAAEYMDGWSLPVSAVTTGENFDASRLDWDLGVELGTGRPGLQLSLPGRPVRMFIEGTLEGIPGLVETHALPRGQSFYLAYNELHESQIEGWATSECEGFEQLDSLTGLPRDWKFASVSEATGDGSTGGDLPFLPSSSSIRIRPVGGIRSSRSNNFFRFAAPDIRLEGGASDASLLCNGVSMTARTAGAAFVLPTELPAESRISLEAKTGARVAARYSIFLTGDFSLPSPGPVGVLDRAGAPVLSADSDTASVAGAYLLGEQLVVPPSTAELVEDMKSELGNTRTFLLGSVPGQVVEWPTRSLPTTWRPVWAIKMRRRRKGDVIFLRESLEGASPGTGTAGSSRDVRTWKEVLWFWRKRITPPNSIPLRQLWQEFREVAHNV